jgi:Pterin 4 alpha carbinolamine dehydratase
MELLSDSEIGERLDGLDGWDRKGEAITKTFKRGDFVGSVEFVRRLVEPAEDMGTIPTSRSPGTRSRSPSPVTQRAASPRTTSSWRRRSTPWRPASFP